MPSEPLIGRFLSHLASGGIVLDLGCGTGRHALDLARAGFRVTGVDLDVDALETARVLAEGTPIAFVAAAARLLPFKEASFDAVLCLDMLHWSADARAFAAARDEALRALKPGGLFAVRARALEAEPAVAPLGGGRYRLASGAEWFLADRAALDARSSAGEWVEPPSLDEDSWRFVLRKG